MGAQTISRGSSARSRRARRVLVGTFLAPIEQPQGFMLKLLYGMTRRQFGRVLTPIKVIVPRMPLGFGMFSGKIAKLDKKLTLPPETQMLVRERVARINVCT